MKLERDYEREAQLPDFVKGSVHEQNVAHLLRDPRSSLSVTKRWLVGDLERNWDQRGYAQYLIGLAHQVLEQMEGERHV